MCFETPDCEVNKRVADLGQVEVLAHRFADDAQLLEVHAVDPAAFEHLQA